MPLKTFYIYDAMHTEIFRMTKELLHALPTYRFYLYGEPYGVLKKQFALVRDQFSMELPEGKLELREYAGSIGHNYSVKLNGTMIGAIVDNMDLTVGNIMFDNAFLIVYDAKYLPQLTALAVMAARELARDKDGGLSTYPDKRKRGESMRKRQNCFWVLQQDFCFCAAARRQKKS